MLADGIKIKKNQLTGIFGCLRAGFDYGLSASGFEQLAKIRLDKDGIFVLG